MFISGGDNMAKKVKAGKCKSAMNDCGCGGAIYILGFIGAAIYHIMNATGFWNGVLGVIKSLVWPAFLVFELFKLVGV